jgi:hypothetical protein
VSEDGDEPRALHAAVLHAAVVAVACGLGYYGSQLCWCVVWRQPLGSSDVLSPLRQAVLMGLAAAVVAHRWPVQALWRSMVEAALVAAVVWNAAFALWLGAEALATLTGRTLGQPVIGFRRALDFYLESLVAPATYLEIGATAVGLLAAARLRRTPWEGLVLVLPVACAQAASIVSVLRGGAPTELFWNILTLSTQVPIIAIALPVLSRVAFKDRTKT